MLKRQLVNQGHNYTEKLWLGKCVLYWENKMCKSSWTPAGEICSAFIGECLRFFQQNCNLNKVINDGPLIMKDRLRWGSMVVDLTVT